MKSRLLMLESRSRLTSRIRAVHTVQQSIGALDESGRNPLVADGDLPLLHKRIIVTAPRQYATKLCSKLINAGARTMWVPGVKITDLTNEEHALFNLDQALLPIVQGKQTYSHIAFTSKNGIYSLVNRLVQITGGLDSAVEALLKCRALLCALGADGEVLNQLGLPVHVSPPEASTQGLVKELVSSGAAHGATVLCPVPLVTGGLTEPSVVPRFLKSLEESGAQPFRINAYVTSLGTSSEECLAETHMLQSGQVQAIAFSSTAEAQGLIQLTGGLEALKHSILKHEILLAAHGPYTAAGVSELLGLPVNCVSKNFKSFDGLIEALEYHWRGSALSVSLDEF